MVHLIVFLVKMIVKAINGNKESVRTTGMQSSYNSNNSSADAAAPVVKLGLGNSTSANNNQGTVTVSNKNKTSDDQKMLYAFLLSIFTSCCCGFSFVVNFVLAIITKKIPHIIGTGLIAVLMIVCFVFYYKADQEKKISPKAVVEVLFNDTLILDITDPQYARDTAKEFLIQKYLPTVQDSASIYQDLGIDMMTYTLFAHKFDTLWVDGEMYTYQSIDEVMYKDVSEMKVDENEVVDVEAEVAPKPDAEIVAPTYVKVYLQEKDRICLYSDEMSLREGKYQTKKDKFKEVKDNMYIYPIALLLLISLIYSFYLWYAVFNLDKDAAKDQNSQMMDTFSRDKGPTVPLQKPESNLSTAAATAAKKTAEASKSSIPKPTVNHAGKIAINTVDVYNLMTIPALNYSQALLIITERTNNGKYSSLDDIKNRNSLSNEITQELAKHIFID